MISVKIELFGSLRQHAEHSMIELSLCEGCGVHELRAALGDALGGDSAKALLQVSAFADNTRILTESDFLERDALLAVLPPVCGG